MSLPTQPVEIETALAGLLPPSVGVGVALVGERSSPHGEEEAAIATAVPSRRREFLAGRACAHVALRAIGRDAAVVGRGAEREPVWPPGVVGSIAHAGSVAGAVAARLEHAWALGLDIELLDPPLEPAVARLVVREDELLGPSPAHGLAPYRAKIAFSVKECVYKALFPRTGWALDFHDVEAGIDLEAGRFGAVVADRFRLRGLPLRRLEGRFRVVDGYVLTALWVPPEGPRAGAPVAAGNAQGKGRPATG